MKNQFYLYEPKNRQITIDSIEKLSQNIKAVIDDIINTEEERKKDNSKKNDSIIGDKFLIKDKNVQQINVNTKQIESFNFLSDKNNKTNSIDEIEIKDIIPPENYSINSLMKSLGSCIFKTQMLPPFIRYSCYYTMKDQINKSKDILSNLFNLYETVKEHGFSLISPRIKEYQKSFEIMISKLQQLGVDFSQSKDIMKLVNIIKRDDNNQIQDFINYKKRMNLN